MCINPFSAELFLYEKWDQRVLSISNYYKYRNYLFSLHFNTNFMGLRSAVRNILVLIR